MRENASSYADTVGAQEGAQEPEETARKPWWVRWWKEISVSAPLRCNGLFVRPQSGLESNRKRPASKAGGRRETMRIEESVEINRPLEEVFDYVADPENLPEWSGIVLEVQKEGRGNPKRATVSPPSPSSSAVGSRRPWR